MHDHMSEHTMIEEMKTNWITGALTHRSTYSPVIRFLIPACCRRCTWSPLEILRRMSRHLFCMNLCRKIYTGTCIMCVLHREPTVGMMTEVWKFMHANRCRNSYGMPNVPHAFISCLGHWQTTSLKWDFNNQSKIPVSCTKEYANHARSRRYLDRLIHRK